MLDFFNTFRSLSFASVCLRLFFCVLCAGAIGLEREMRRRSAGFRTHILLCLAAALTTLTPEFMAGYMGYYTDISRLGAGVIAGIGFLGAGAIITTRDKRIHGLTTAAGLWTVAIIGLSFGAGFFEIGLIATALILFAEVILIRFEIKLNSYAPTRTLYVEYEKKSTMEVVLRYLKNHGLRTENVTFTKTPEVSDDGKKTLCALIAMEGISQTTLDSTMKDLRKVRGITDVQEID